MIEGPDLFEHLRAEPLPWRKALDIGTQIACTLDVVHRGGLVHRYVKPANIAKLMDFGVVCIIDKYRIPTCATQRRWSGSPGGWIVGRKCAKVQPVQTRHTLALWLVACQPSSVAHISFGGASGVTTTAGTGSTTSPGTSTGSESGSGGGSADTMLGPVNDLGGIPDFGDTSPAGCRGKIDFLFVISRHANMAFRQEQLALAFPQFIDTIESKFADFDYHIMVVTGDDWWGSDLCDSVCPDLSCKIGDPCCDGGDASQEGKPCCASPDYPCDKQDLVSTCDWLWGAGEVFPAGNGGASNKPCPVEGGRRYLVKGQTDLKGTFECIAKVGSSGWGALGQALAAAVQHNLNGPGGCNGGFLRDDALLMVTSFGQVDVPGHDSEGTPAEWAQAVIDAKHGDDKSVIMFNIGTPDCLPDDPSDRMCVLAKMFPFHHLLYGETADWGPGFAQAASLVETACAGFTPPPG